MKNLILIAISLLSTKAIALVPEGRFENRHDDVVIFVKNVVQNGETNTYAFIQWRKDAGSLYRIEELDGDSQSWIQIIQSEDNILSTDVEERPTFDVTVSRLNNELTLNLAPTPYATMQSCPQHSRTFLRTQETGWVGIPNQEVSFDERYARGTVRPIAGNPGKYLLTGHYQVNGRPWSGKFIINELFPGLGVMRAMQINSESIDGRYLERRVAGMVITTQKSGWFGTNYTVFNVLNLSPGNISCAAFMTQLIDP